jgi:hypothetical protein
MTVRMSNFLRVPTLSDLLTPSIRELLARARSEAMRKGAESGLRLITVSNDMPLPDRIAIHVARAEILHLDQRAEEAISLLDHEVIPDARILKDEIALVLEQNRVLVVFGSGFPDREELDRHYGNIDRRRLLKVTTRDADALLTASAASVIGKSSESLPIYTAALYDAYRRFDWRGSRESARYMVQEQLRLGDPVAAAFYSVLSEDKTSADAVAEYLRSRNDKVLLDQALRAISDVSHLRRHVLLSAKLVARLGDAVPDHRVADWLRRFQPARQVMPSSFPERWLFDAAWEATAVLVGGAEEEEASSLISEILSHPLWALGDAPRLGLFPALNAAAKVASEVKCAELCAAIAPLVRAENPGVDQQEAAKTLFVMSSRFPKLKLLIRDLIFNGKTTISLFLARIAPAFEVKLTLEDAATKASAMIKRLRLQVERLAEGEEASHGFGELMVQSHVVPNGRVVVRLYSSHDEMIVLFSHRASLPATTIEELVATIIALIRDPENLNANREFLFDTLVGFTDVMTPHAAANSVSVMAEFAADHRLFGHPLHGQDEVHSPLDSFRVEGNFPQRVRGAALLALAKTSTHHPDLVGAFLNGLLSMATIDSNAEVRRWGYEAVSEAGELGRVNLPRVVSGTRDSDSDTANIALQVCGVQAKVIVEDKLTPLLLGSLEAQCRNPDDGIRFAVAIVASKLLAASGEKSNPDSERLGALVNHLKSDVSRRVRVAAQYPKP